MDEFSLLRTLHYLTGSAALGAVVVFDAALMWQVYRLKVQGDSRADMLPSLTAMHRGLIGVLCVMWLTGLVLWTRSAAFPELHTKISLKLIVVAALTVNAMAMQRFVLPTYQACGSLTELLRAPQLPRLAMHAALSTVLWISAAIVGREGWLKYAPYGASFGGLCAVLAFVLAVAFGLGLLVRARSV